MDAHYFSNITKLKKKKKKKNPPSSMEEHGAYSIGNNQVVGVAR
jgi:hypothetical protein